MRDPSFKRVLAEARDEDLVEFTSVAGLPARAVATPWLRKLPEGRCPGCRRRCTPSRAAPWPSTAWRNAGCATAWPAGASSASTTSSPPRCAATPAKGLFFRGVGALPFGGQIRSVRELIERLLAPHAAPAG